MADDNQTDAVYDDRRNTEDRFHARKKIVKEKNLLKEVLLA